MRDLTAVAVGIGPGPYTGLRVGVATAGAVADALGVPAYGVCTLDVLAHQAGSERAITAITDARRREVFWACYDAGGHRVAGPNVNRPADVALRGRAVGPGALLYADVFDVSEAEQVSAGALCSVVADRLAAQQPLEPARPIYLRRPDTAPAQSAKPVLQT